MVKQRSNGWTAASLGFVSKVHGANMGPTCGRQDPGGPHVGHVNLAVWVRIPVLSGLKRNAVTTKTSIWRTDGYNISDRFEINSFWGMPILIKIYLIHRVILTTSNAASGDNFIKMTIFVFQWCCVQTYRPYCIGFNMLRKKKKSKESKQ